MKIETHDADALAEALADRVAGNLREAIEIRGRATLAVPGGTTPAPFLKALGQADLDWSRVAVTLTDERCVATDHPRSNYQMVSEALFGGAAQSTRFLPIYDPSVESADVSAALREHILPLDVCVLGMGADMHTASLFPGADALAQAISPTNGEVVLPITAPGADEPRVTLTVPSLVSAPHTYLLIKGADKRVALDKAVKADTALIAPVKAILDAATDLTVFYAD